MMELDHLAVACETLEEGQAAVEEALGVTLQQGGKHAHFGTHNMLLGLEDGLYLEVIAIDPEAPAPAWPRWFDLDRFSGKPRLTNWICRTDDLAALRADLPEAGAPVPLERGDLRWTMAVPADGVLPYDNLFPPLIEWGAGVAHPAGALRPSGCRLARLVVSHPEAEALADRLYPHLHDARVAFESGAPGLRAEIETPSGARVLT
ncbi:VOC family protein [Roseovarius spongiae]|uniref:VOC family protein n=1 Tax=Roseovarius spongiae TaxID=2320272 RepID=A0A3A8AXR5_9RHOB|nr:VOC family protein [Roseovarius spongiae]RKF14921.1 VOC family protein [Roseovarius spongiae]